MIFRSGKYITVIFTLLLTGAVVILLAKVILLGKLTALTVLIASEVSVLRKASCTVDWPYLTSYNIGFDLDVTDSQSQIIRIQGPCVRNLMIRDVGRRRRSGNIDGGISARVDVNDLALV